MEATSNFSSVVWKTPQDWEPWLDDYYRYELHCRINDLIAEKEIYATIAAEKYLAARQDLEQLRDIARKWIQIQTIITTKNPGD